MKFKRRWLTVSYPKRISPEWTTAFSTVVMAVATGTLVFVTWRYVDLTNNLVRLQIAPSIEAGLEEPFTLSTTFVVRNAGADSVPNVIVNIRCFYYRGPNDDNPGMSFAGLPWNTNKSWWHVGTLRPGDVLKKDSIEFLALCLQHRKVYEDVENKAAKERAKGLNVEAVRLGAMVVFDLSYQREVDYKAYHVSIPARLTRDAKTDKPALIVRPISQEYKHFLKELW